MFFDVAPAPFRRAVMFILFAAVLDIMAMGIVIPVLPALIEEFAGSNAAAGPSAPRRSKPGALISPAPWALDIRNDRQVSLLAGDSHLGPARVGARLGEAEQAEAA